MHSVSICVGVLHYLFFKRESTQVSASWGGGAEGERERILSRAPSHDPGIMTESDAQPTETPRLPAMFLSVKMITASLVNIHHLT